jgi:hypothetical protein
MRGYHSRNYIHFDVGCYGVYTYYKVLHEITCSTRGVFSIVQYEPKTYVVAWRANRNTTRDTTLMIHGGIPSWDYPCTNYKTLDEAIASIPYWNRTFNVPKQPSRTRDAQKSKVYKWEHIMAADLTPTTNGVNALTVKRDEATLQSQLEFICDVLGERTPKLKLRSGGGCSFAGEYHGIQLLPAHQNYLVLMHELAHILHIRWGSKDSYGNAHQSHGQEYVGVYAYLLIQFGGVEQHALITHAAKARVKLLLPTCYWDWANERKAA